MSDQTSDYSTTQPTAFLTKENAFADRVRNMINKVCTMQLVKVIACTNAGALAVAGTVDVQILVNQIDGYGNPTPHGTIYGLPYNRMQGGTNAVIMDPVAGDIGLIMVSSHDISNVKSTGAQANPGSRRRFNYSDSVYIGGVLNGVPTQYFMFNGDGITAVSPTAITLQAPSIVLAGNVSSTGTFVNNGTDISSTHYHGGVETGGGVTSPPE